MKKLEIIWFNANVELNGVADVVEIVIGIENYALVPS